MRQPSTFPGRAQVADRRLARTIDRLAETWERLDFSVPVATGQRVVVYGSYTFTTYTTGGAAMIGLETADFVSMMPWTDGLGSILFFKWDSVAHEMVITDWAGTELANGTDISDIVSHPYSAALDGSGGAAMTPQAAFRMIGAGRVLALELETSEDFAASATRYWTITARVRRAVALRPQDDGELVGSYSTQTRSLVAGEPVTLYESEEGLDVDDDDRLVLTAVATSTPNAMLGATAWAKIQRRVS